MSKITFVNENDEMVSYPSKFIICEICDGSGTHVNPSIDGNGLTSSDLEEWSDEEYHNYRSGAYDVSCWFCDGIRVVAIIDEDILDMDNAYIKNDALYWFNNFYAEKLDDVYRRMRIAGGSSYYAEY